MNKKVKIGIMVAIIIIGTIVAGVVINNRNVARRNHVNVMLNSFSYSMVNFFYKTGFALSENERVIEKNYVLVNYYGKDGKTMLGVELDKNADKIKRIYGNFAFICEERFKEEYKERLADDFKVEYY